MRMFLTNGCVRLVAYIAFGLPCVFLLADCDRIANGDQQMKTCAQVCRKCAQSCGKMAGATV
ncbi:MAG TPA: four-helix bundle copper-binding protein [Phycisphaerae bacterium]|nr:four-helix bundle copper-binding protein [Phycisphaerae bacterium]